MKLEDIVEKLIDSIEYYTISLVDDMIIVQGEWEDNGCKNDDDCCNEARDIGEEIIKEYSNLEIYGNYCHRHKYTIVELKEINLVK